MTHGNRRPDRRLEQEIRNIIFSGIGCRRDRTEAETISILSREEILGIFDHPIQVGFVPDLERGEVLVDSRGRGTLENKVILNDQELDS